MRSFYELFRAPPCNLSDTLVLDAGGCCSLYTLPHCYRLMTVEFQPITLNPILSYTHLKPEYRTDCRGAHEKVVLEGFSGVINWTM